MVFPDHTHLLFCYTNIDLLDPSGSLKPSPLRLGVQHHPRGPADVNAQKNMFDPYNNIYFDNMVSQIYLSELQFNKANTSDTEALFLDFQFFIVSTNLKFMINLRI